MPYIESTQLVKLVCNYLVPRRTILPLFPVTRVAVFIAQNKSVIDVLQIFSFWKYSKLSLLQTLIDFFSLLIFESVWYMCGFIEQILLMQGLDHWWVGQTCMCTLVSDGRNKINEAAYFQSVKLCLTIKYPHPYPCATQFSSDIMDRLHYIWKWSEIVKLQLI